MNMLLVIYRANCYTGNIHKIGLTFGFEFLDANKSKLA